MTVGAWTEEPEPDAAPTEADLGVLRRRQAILRARLDRVDGAGRGAFEHRMEWSG